MRGITGGWLAVALFSVARLSAADDQPAIGLGATRAEVIAALGTPIGHANLGTVEILRYPHGQVRLEKGRVEKVSLKSVAAAPPVAPVAPTPGPSVTSVVATPAAAETGDPLAEVWLTRVDDALRDASRRNCAILLMATTSDASPASRQFQKEIVFHPEFVNAFRGHYVLLNIDELRTAPPETREQNEILRRRFGVTGAPALVIISDAGEKIAVVDIAASAPGSAFRGRLIAAVTAANPFPIPSLSLPVEVSPPAPPAPAAPPSVIHVAPTQVTAGLTSARWLIIAALCGGTLIAGAMLFVVWLMIRKLNKPVALSRRSSMAHRIDHAASGLPTPAEILTWPKERLRDVTARLAEMEGYEAEAPALGSDKDLFLRRPGMPTAEVIVCCATGNAGVIPTRRMREMVGMLAADHIASGWFVSPAGFSLEARAYAEEQNIRLIDGARLLAQLGDLPTFVLPKVLASVR